MCLTKACPHPNHFLQAELLEKEKKHFKKRGLEAFEGTLAEAHGYHEDTTQSKC